MTVSEFRAKTRWTIAHGKLIFNGRECRGYQIHEDGRIYFNDGFGKRESNSALIDDIVDIRRIDSNRSEVIVRQ